MSTAKRGSAVTMHEVAARAGVSIKTVSNVVNGYQYIRPATKERVEAAIADLGYQVNISARNLRRGRTGIIGLAVPELSLPYFAELADSVIRAAEARGPDRPHRADRVRARARARACSPASAGTSPTG